MFGWHYNILYRGSKTLRVKGVLKIIDEFSKFVKEHNLQVTEKIMGDDLNEIRKKLKNYLQMIF